MKVLLQVLVEVETSIDNCGDNCPWLTNGGCCSLFDEILSSSPGYKHWRRCGDCRESETRVIKR